MRQPTVALFADWDRQTVRILQNFMPSAGIQSHFVNFGRNISFGQSHFYSVLYANVAKLAPLCGKPKWGFWHNYARPDN